MFALFLFLNGVSMGMFASPNRAGVMNSLPPGDRGAGGGMNQTFQNSAQVLSVGIFFTLMILGLSATLPHTMASGLEAHGVSAHAAQHAANLPPVSILFAAFLGYNPIQHLLGSSVAQPAAGAHAGGAHRPLVLPAADLGAVPQRTARGVRVRDRRLPGRRGRVVVAGRALRRRRRCRWETAAAGNGAGDRRSAGPGAGHGARELGLDRPAGQPLGSGRRDIDTR